jgi:hypothetical protein
MQALGQSEMASVTGAARSGVSWATEHFMLWGGSWCLTGMAQTLLLGDLTSGPSAPFSIVTLAKCCVLTQLQF